MSALNTFFVFPTLKTISYGAQRRVKLCHRTKLNWKRQIDGLGPLVWQAAALYYFLTFYPARTNCNGRVLLWSQKSLKKKWSLFSAIDLQEKSLKTNAFHEQKQCDLRSRLRTSSYGESSGPRETYWLLSKKMSGQQIHLILTPLKPYGASSTKLRQRSDP